MPEGFYTITPGQMNPNSHYYLSFNVGYPNAYDRALGRTGGDIMVHGVCSSAGCFSMTDAQIAEIYAIAREAFNGGQSAIQMQSFPFRMTRREPRQAPARSQHRVLEGDQERRRPFRGDEDRARACWSAASTTSSARIPTTTSTPAPPARPICSATTRSRRRSPTRRRATIRRWRRWSPRASSRSRSSTRTAARTPPSPAGRTSTRARPRRSPRGPSVITLDNSGKPLPPAVKVAAAAPAPAPAAAPAAASAPPAASPTSQPAANATGASPFGFLSGDGVKSFFGLGGSDAPPPQIKVFEPAQPIPTDAPLPPKRNAALDARGPQASAALRTNAD